MIPGIIFGFLLFLLGIYEWFNAFGNGGEEIVPAGDISAYKPFLSVWFFDLCFIMVGLGMVITNVLLHIRYNKYKIIGKKVTSVAYPNGIYNDDIDWILKQELGIEVTISTNFGCITAYDKPFNRINRDLNYTSEGFLGMINNVFGK